MLGCAEKLPDSDLCIANVPGQKLDCYNLLNDYQKVNNVLVLKPGATPHFKPLLSTNDVNKWTCTDPTSWTNLVTFLKQEQSRCTCK